MLRLENINVHFESVPMLLNRMTTDDVTCEDVCKIDNLLNTWKKIGSKSIPSESLEGITEINRTVQYGLYGPDEEEGRIRTEGVRISGTSWQPAVPIKKDVESDVRRILSLDGAVRRAVEMFLYLVKAQLFYDGNKRTAQMAAAGLLYDENKVISIQMADQMRFKKMLISFYESDESKDAIKDFLTERCIFERSFG